MDKILSNGAFNVFLRQKLASVALRNVEWFSVKIVNFLKIFKKSKIDDFHWKSLKIAESHRSELLPYVLRQNSDIWSISKLGIQEFFFNLFLKIIFWKSVFCASCAAKRCTNTSGTSKAMICATNFPCLNSFSNF